MKKLLGIVGLGLLLSGNAYAEIREMEEVRAKLRDYSNSRITHQRADNSRYYWVYDKGVQTGDQAAVGSLGPRQDL